MRASKTSRNSGKISDRIRPTKRCPSCGSADITLWMGASLGMQYQCKKCGYHGPLVIEDEPEKD